MNDTVNLLLAVLTGMVLGAIFFGALWWTVLHGATAKQPALWFFISLLLRTSITLAGFYLVARGHWERLLLCFLGFIIARHVVLRITRAPERPIHLAQEEHHAPNA